MTEHQEQCYHRCTRLGTQSSPGSGRVRGERHGSARRGRTAIGAGGARGTRRLARAGGSCLCSGSYVPHVGCLPREARLPVTRLQLAGLP